MARIAGVNIPDEKRVVIALTYVYGIGATLSEQILKAAKIDKSVRTRDLTEDELTRIREIIDKNHEVEGDLQQRVRININRLKDIGSFKGDRHKRNLPVRGQRTKTNARTKRGKRVTVGSGRIKTAGKT
ncbi:MAG: 30S ribosomal protein S13 [Candidatus Saccharimonadales bacterium]